MELVAQEEPGGIAQLDRVDSGLFEPGLFHEDVADLFGWHVDGRAHDMEGRPFELLGDELAQVSLEGFDPGRLEFMVEPGLLGHHGLALGDIADALLARQVDDKGVGLFGVAGPDHPGAVAFGVALELLEQLGQIGHNLGADGLGEFLGRIRIGEAGHDHLAHLGDHRRQQAQKGLGPLVLHLDLSNFTKSLGSNLHRQTSFPARKLAMCMTLFWG